MKIKVCIANYGISQIDYLYRVVDEFNSFKNHSVNVVVYSTEKLDMEHKLYPSDIGKALPFACRKDMIDSIPNYELFIYNENDMLITEQNIDSFLEHSSTLTGNRVSGFIRYEIDKNKNKVLLDPNPFWGPLVKNKTESNFELNNVHQGCWILLRKDLKKAIDSGGFSLQSHESPYGMLEQGASDPYTQCQLTKVFPLNYDLCSNLLIHHLPNKYKEYTEWINYGISLKQLINNINEYTSTNRSDRK